MSCGSRPVRRILVVPALALAGAACLAGVGPPGAAARSRPPLEIVAPRQGALVTTRLVNVKVRTRRPDADLRVTMYGRGRQLQRVSGLFHRVGPGLLVARLRAGGRLRFGSNSIYVRERGRRAAAETTFTAARPGGRLLSVRRVEHGAVETSPLDLRFGAHARGETVRAKLNGHAARSSFEPIGPRGWRAELGPKDGLRYGRNHLLVTAFTRAGRYQRKQLAFTVRRDSPVADAGRDRLTQTGVPLRLDGSATLSDGPPLKLRWRVMRKPKGSHPVLRGADTAHPWLRADVNGAYRLRLLASHPGRRAATGSAATASAATPSTSTSPSPEPLPSPEPPPSPGPPPSPVPPSPVEPTGPTVIASTTDEVEVDAAPQVLPSGVPLQTMVHRGVQVGFEFEGSFYPMSAGASVQMLVVDRRTLEVKTALSGSYGASEAQKLLETVAGLEGNVLVILSGGGGAPVSSQQPLQEAIARIGGLTSGPQSVGILGELGSGGHGDWSVVGIPGTSPGSGYQLIGLEQGPDGNPGGMLGNLQLDSGGEEFGFTWAPEYNSYDSAPPAASQKATENTVEVDGARYSSWDLPFPEQQATTGFHLLWLDADTLKPRLNATAEMNLSVPEEEQGKGLWTLRNDLRQILAEPKPGIIVLNTIGKVTTPSFTDVVDGHDGNTIEGNVLARVSALLEEFGANPYVFNTFGATSGFGAPGEAGGRPPGEAGGYSLVGVTGMRELNGPNAGTELSTRLIEGSSARLAGALTRDRQGVLMPTASGSPSGGIGVFEALPSTLAVLAQKPQPFKDWAELSPSEQQGQEELGKLLGLEVDKQSDGIRGNYWGNQDIAWSTKAGLAATICQAVPPKPSPCSAAAQALAPELAKEFEEVDEVRTYFSAAGGIGEVFNNVFDSVGLRLQNIAEEVQKEFNPPDTAAVGPNVGGIMQGVLNIAGGMGGAIPVLGPSISAAGRMTAGVAQIEEAARSTSGGGTAFDPYGFHTTMAGLAGELAKSIEVGPYAVSHTGDLLVSDAGRLEKAAELIGISDEAGGWGLDTQTRAQLESRLRLTTRQFIWLTMLQPVMATYECAAEDAGGVAKHNREAAFSTLATYPAWRDRQNPRTFNLYYTNIMLGNRQHWGWPRLADKAMTEHLFGRPELGGGNGNDVGFLPEYLMAPASASGGVSESKESSLLGELEEEVEVEDEEDETVEAVKPLEQAVFNQALQPTSTGLLLKNMNMKTRFEDTHTGLARRYRWSEYRPSCGKGQNLGSSDPAGYAQAEP